MGSFMSKHSLANNRFIKDMPIEHDMHRDGPKHYDIAKGSHAHPHDGPKKYGAMKGDQSKTRKDYSMDKGGTDKGYKGKDGSSKGDQSATKKDYESGGPGMHKTGHETVKDEYGTTVPKGFKSDMGNINPTITSTTKVNKNQRPLTKGDNTPFSEGDVVETRNNNKYTTSTILKSNLKDSEKSKPHNVRNMNNLKSQTIQNRTEEYSDGVTMMSKGPHKEKWERQANRARRANERGNTKRGAKLEAKARKNYKN